MIKKYLEAQLAADQAKNAPAAGSEENQPVYATKADVESAVSELGKTLVEQLGEQVQKALTPPAPERGEGTGRRGQVNDGSEPQDEVALFIQKAQTNPDELSVEEKEALYRLSYSVLTEGLRP